MTTKGMFCAAMSRISTAFIYAFFTGAYAQEDSVHFERIKMSSYVDFGSIVSDLSLLTGKESTGKEQFPLLNRLSASLIQKATLGDDFEASVGVGGYMWYSFKPANRAAIYERSPKWLPRVSVAEGKWYFGQKEDRKGFLELGYFPYKYNPDARNLGEYLYRSNTYPGILWTTDGGAGIMNTAQVYGEGAHFRWNQFRGALHHDLTLFVERSSFPAGNMSPGYEFTFKYGILELGGGVAYQNLFSFRPSLLAQKNFQNNYVRVPAQVIDTPNVGGIPDTIPAYEGPGSLAPDAINRAFQSYPNDTIHGGDTAFHYQNVHTYTSQGVKLMGRGSLDLSFVLPVWLGHEDDFKVFTEIAVLGVKSQPYFYDKITERTPIMFGANLPTFNFLSLLSVQAEWYGGKYNNIDDFLNQSYSIWTTDREQKAIRKDDWKWTVYGKKKVNKLCTVYAQAASDHLRLQDADVPPVYHGPLTLTPSDWYYLFRLEFAI